MGFTIDPQVIQGHQLQQDHQQFAESFPVVCGLVIAAAAAQHRQLLRRRDRLQGGAKVGLAPGGRDGAGDPKKKGGSERVPRRSRKWLDVLRICLLLHS